MTHDNDYNSKTAFMIMIMLILMISYCPGGRTTSNSHGDENGRYSDD